jgi:hypothetical protein
LNDAIVQQFDIVENLNPVTRGRYPFVVVLQHDRTSTLSTLVVAPLTNAGATLVPTRLNPFIRVGSRDFVVVAEALAAVQKRTLGKVIDSAESHRYAIIAAIDALFTGI